MAKYSIGRDEKNGFSLLIYSIGGAKTSVPWRWDEKDSEFSF